MTASIPRIVEAVRRHQSTTIGLLSVELGIPRERIAADLGGLHDYGYVTRYGDGLESRVTWQGVDDLYVRTCVDEASRDSEETHE